MLNNQKKLQIPNKSRIFAPSKLNNTLKNIRTMTVAEPNFHKLSDEYEKLIRKFFKVNNIKEVVCTDKKEHFFDRIEVKKNGTITVYAHGLTKTTWKKLYFDFTVDYAVCLANMEHDLFLQQRQGKHEKFNFYFYN